MSKILITGNGFDLYHGLPTTYLNFIETLSKIEKASSISTDYLHYFKSNDSFNTIEFDETMIQDIKDRLNNKWYLFFKDELKFDTWIDFESKLEETLKVIWSFISNTETNIFSNNDVDFRESQKFEKIKINKIKRLKLLLYFELISRCESYSDSFRFNEKYTEHFNNKYTNLKEDVISEMLLAELNSFINIFDLYFQTFVLPLINLLKSSNKYKPFLGIDKYYTFNYTNSFELLYKQESTTVEYLHGRIGAGSEKNNMVLGFNDIEDKVTNKKFYIPFTKYFQTLEKETDYKFLKGIKDFSENYEDTILYLWGHSLDISDKLYFEEIIDLLHENEDFKMKVFYHNKRSKSKMLINLINMLDEYSITNLMKKDQIQFLILNEENVNLELRIKSKLRELYV